MNRAIIKGIVFGLTSAIITTLGLIVGLASSTNSKLVVLGGVLTIAIADAFSDAMGVHVSVEAENIHTFKEIWAATFATFFTKLIFALTFAIPVILFSLSTAIIISIVWGVLVLSTLSYVIAKTQGEPPWKIIGEHLLIAVVVIIITHFVGGWVRTLG